jgi:hypothetical protein
MHPTASLDVFKIIHAYYAGSPIQLNTCQVTWDVGRDPLLYNTNTDFLYLLKHGEAMPAKQLLCNFHVLSGSEGCTSFCKDLVQDVKIIPNELSEIFPLEYSSFFLRCFGSMRRANVSGVPCTFAIFRGCNSSAERVF